MSERKCGTCQHWDKSGNSKKMSSGSFGLCGFDWDDIPCVRDIDFTKGDAGAKCPLWQPKEAAE